MKLKLPSVPPRNPCVAAALFRQAGRHGKDSGARRLQERRDLGREVMQEDGGQRQPQAKWGKPEP